VTRVLVLGASGMLGHKVWQELVPRFDARATVRTEAVPEPAAAVLDPERTVTGVTVEDPGSVARALERSGAEVAINCIGVVKQARAASDAPVTVRGNALFPHEVAVACRERGVRLVHISTDCVFSGDRGRYREDDVPDARDLYGRSKLLGEVTTDGCLTLRTSIVGRELSGSHGLLEWLIGERGRAVRGFTRAVFSGLTTEALARELASIVAEGAELDGLWHVGGDPIAKHELLALARKALDLDVEIVPDDSVVIDRSLDSQRYREATGRTPPSWPEMLADLAADPTPYASIRAGTLTSPGASRA
jgi:dTDP-4-dehydrorhamnose reductase